MRLLRELRGGFCVLPAFAFEGVEEGDELGAFGVAEVEFDDAAVAAAVSDASLAVEVHQVFEGFHATVVHPGSGFGDVTEGGYFEGGPVVLALGDGASAFVQGHAVRSEAEVGEFLGAEIGAAVALAALGRAEEELHAAEFFAVELGAVASDVFVVAGVAGKEDSLEGGDGLGDAVEVDLRGAESFGEVGAVAGDAGDGFGGAVLCTAHF